MYSIQIHKDINRLITFFYRIGIWHKGNEATARDVTIKWFYIIYYLLFIISLVIGAIKSDSKDECIFSVEMSIAAAILHLKHWVLIWKQKQILELVNRICIFTVHCHDDFLFVNEKLRGFTKYARLFLFAIAFAGLSAVIVTPFLGSEKNLFFKIAFPLDWKLNEINFWIANAFLLSEVVLTTATVPISIIIWYVILNCSLRYKVLGNELTKMGKLSEGIQGRKKKLSVKEQHNYFIEDLKASIDAHLHIRELISELESFCSNLFFVQMGTSGLCICGSTYCMAFDVSEDLVERLFHFATLFYHISEIFMITYLGNEIKLSSDRLSYCLFESDWIEQPQSTKKCIIIFGEYLKQPHELIIGKLYPLSLETFTRILNSAYSMFNILKNTAK